MSAPTQISAEGALSERTGEEADPFRFGWRYVWQKGEDGLMVQVQVPLAYEDVLHPQEEDFIVQTSAHDCDCHYLKSALLRKLAGRDGVEVLHDVRVDWQVEGIKPHGPDLSIFANVPKSWKRETGTLLVKTVGARPMMVIEVTSPSTRSFDLDEKVIQYHKAGVPFYAIVDFRPEMEDRLVHLLGFRATPEGYIRVPLNEHGRLWLEPVGLWLAAEVDHVGCYDAKGDRVPDVVELDRAVREAATRAEKAETRAEKAENDAELARQSAADLAARMAELEAELKRLRGGPGAAPPSGG